MKQVTATDARKRWFRLLDEVAAGETVVVERAGERIVLRREAQPASRARVPSYVGILVAKDADRADEWGWRWRRPGGLEPRAASTTRGARRPAPRR